MDWRVAPRIWSAMMIRTQIYLTERQQQELRRLAGELGESQSELIREAIDRLIQEKRPDRLTLLRAARGMWKDRTDIAELTAMRGEADERLGRLFGDV
jgi:Arc/MetJ-type ribon-helix-helix transcriptional regulator